MLLKNCRFIVTQDRKRRVLEKEDILIEGDCIAAIGKGLKPEGSTELIDCSGKIVMPGLVNTHTHLGMHSLKGKCDDEELFGWLSKLGPEEKKLSSKEVKENTLAGLAEAVRFGTTTIYDSYKFPQERLEAFVQSGVRGVISSTVTDGKGFSEAKKFISGIGGGLVKGAIAANSIYNCDEETIMKVIEYSDKSKLLRRIHVGETRKERFDILKKTGKLAVEYLGNIGFLAQNALLVHCIWITKGEIGMIAKAGAKVSHNPISNMKLASGGVMPLVEMLEEKVTVGLGSDSVASNNNLDMFEEMKFAALLHRHHKWDPNAVSSQQILDMATINGAKCLGLSDVGSIEIGKKADIITLGLEDNLMPVNDAVSAIVFSASGMNTCDVIVDGKTLMRERKFAKIQ